MLASSQGLVPLSYAVASAVVLLVGALWLLAQKFIFHGMVGPWTILVMVLIGIGLMLSVSIFSNISTADFVRHCQTSWDLTRAQWNNPLVSREALEARQQDESRRQTDYVLEMEGNTYVRSYQHIREGLRDTSQATSAPQIPHLPLSPQGLENSVELFSYCVVAAAMTLLVCIDQWAGSAFVGSLTRVMATVRRVETEAAREVEATVGNPLMTYSLTPMVGLWFVPLAWSWILFKADYITLPAMIVQNTLWIAAGVIGVGLWHLARREIVHQGVRTMLPFLFSKDGEERGDMRNYIQPQGTGATVTTFLLLGITITTCLEWWANGGPTSTAAGRIVMMLAGALMWRIREPMIVLAAVTSTVTWPLTIAMSAQLIRLFNGVARAQAGNLQAILVYSKIPEARR
jgi:hypothetical protein